jgi:hypothetical protein
LPAATAVLLKKHILTLRYRGAIGAWIKKIDLAEEEALKALDGAVENEKAPSPTATTNTTTMVMTTT